MGGPETHLPVSYAEHWEDVRLWRVLGGLEPGFYVDVGAMDPSLDSVTRAFYERGWRGIDVEPNPYFAERLRSARPRDRVEQVAAGLRRDRATLHVVTLAGGEQTGLTTLDAAIAERHVGEGGSVSEVEVDVVPLAELMEGSPAEDPARFHFLKVDVEGLEPAVLAGAKLEKFRPLVVVIEARAPRRAVDTYPESETILEGAGYSQAADDGLNRWYVRSEDAMLAEVLAPEVNPLLDGVPKPAREVELLERIDELDAACRAEAARVKALQVEFEKQREKADALRTRLDELLRSRSWRMTAPLRAAARALHKPPS
jgi:FkbM family methyltransferase